MMRLWLLLQRADSPSEVSLWLLVKKAVVLVTEWVVAFFGALFIVEPVLFRFFVFVHLLDIAFFWLAKSKPIPASQAWRCLWDVLKRTMTHILMVLLGLSFANAVVFFSFVDDWIITGTAIVTSKAFLDHILTADSPWRTIWDRIFGKFAKIITDARGEGSAEEERPAKRGV